MKTLVMDCSSIMYQAAYSMGDLSHDESPTGVIYGFLKSIEGFSHYFRTHKFVFSWDSKKSIRRDHFPFYKRKGGSIDEEKLKISEMVHKQGFILRDYILPSLGFENHFLFSGFESDDVIASIVQNNPRYTFVTISTDADLYQLLDYTDINSPGKKRKYITRESFIDQYEIEPKQWSLVKAIAGCSSDNVPGVVGIGEKRAISYIRGTLKGKALQTISTEESKQIIERNKWLVTLPHPEFNKETTLVKGEKFSVKAFDEICQEYGIFSLDRDHWIENFDME